MRVFLAVLCCVMLVLACVACKPKTSKGVATQTAAPPAPTETQASTTGPIKFGFNLEETGNAATFGISDHKGAELAVNEINAAGGVMGRQIEAVWGDNASLSQQSATVAAKLINQDKCDVLIGATTSSNTIAMAKVAEEAKRPMLSPAATNPSVTLNEDGSARKYVFRVCFTDDFQGERMADFAVNGPIKAKQACIFYDADSDYSVGIWETIKRVAPAKGLTIVAEDSFLSSSETDFRTKLNKFKGQKFDVLIVPGYYNQVAMIANQAREMGIKQPMLGGDGWDSPDLWKNAGKNIEGCYFTNHYAATDQDPAVQDFITKYKAAYGGNVPDAMAILGYDAVKLMADAIARAGSTDSEAVTAALASTKDFHGASGLITINPQHNADKKLVVIKIGAGGAFEWSFTYEPGQGGTPAPATPAAAGAPAAGTTPPAAGEAGGGAPPPAEGSKKPGPTG